MTIDEILTRLTALRSGDGMGLMPVTVRRKGRPAEWLRITDMDRVDDDGATSIIATVVEEA